MENQRDRKPARNHINMGNELSAIVQEKRQGKTCSTRKTRAKTISNAQDGKVDEVSVAKAKEFDWSCKISREIYNVRMYIKYIDN